MKTEEAINEKILAQVVEAALNETRGNRRWQNAISRAALMIRTNPFMHWTGYSLVILSESGERYEANDLCQCKAFQSGRPCKHRAAYKL